MNIGNDQTDVQMSLQEQLYYGSVFVTLEAVQGTAFSFNPYTFKEIADQHAKDDANRRVKPLSHLGDEYKHLLVPGIPATDHVINLQADSSTVHLPEVLRNPLLKSEKGGITGVQSGARSALLKINGEWYRLKGCGDLYKGFPFAPVLDNEFPGSEQIRGCAFEHTTSRELYISSIVEKMLKPVGFESANKPVGWWEYNLPNTIKPKIKRCCIVAKTLGNKRLGDNVLLGLEKLIPSIIDPQHDALLSKFPADRLDIGNEECPVFPTSIVSLTGAFGGEQDFHDFKLQEKVPQKSGPKYDMIDQKWHATWDECCQILKKILPLQEKSRISYHTYLLEVGS